MGSSMQAQDAAYSAQYCLWELEAGTLQTYSAILSGILPPLHLLERKTKISTDLSRLSMGLEQVTVHVKS